MASVLLRLADLTERNALPDRPRCRKRSDRLLLHDPVIFHRVNDRLLCPLVGGWALGLHLTSTPDFSRASRASVSANGQQRRAASGARDPAAQRPW